MIKRLQVGQALSSSFSEITAVPRTHTSNKLYVQLVCTAEHTHTRTTDTALVQKSSDSSNEAAVQRGAQEPASCRC